AGSSCAASGPARAATARIVVRMKIILNRLWTSRTKVESDGRDWKGLRMNHTDAGGGDSPGLGRASLPGETAYRETAKGAKTRIGTGRRLALEPPRGDRVFDCLWAPPQGCSRRTERPSAPPKTHHPISAGITERHRTRRLLPSVLSRFRDMQTPPWLDASPPSASPRLRG